MYFSIEWLDNELKTINDERKRIDLVSHFCFNALDFLFEECYALSNEYYEKAINLNYVNGQAMLLMCKSYYLREKGKLEESKLLLKATEDLFYLSNSAKDISVAFNYLAVTNWILGNREKAFQQAYEARKIGEQNSDLFVLTWSSYQFGVFYSDLKNYDLSLSYFEEAKELAHKSKDPYAIARTGSGIASIEIMRGNFDRALEVNAEALAIYRQCGQKTGESRALNDLGMLYKKLGNISEAIKNLSAALELRVNLNYAQGIITSQIELADIYIELGELEKAKSLLIPALQISETSGAKLKESRTNKLLYSLYKKEGNTQLALLHFEKFFAVQSILSGEEMSNKISLLQQKNATEKSDQEAEIHRLKNVDLKKAYSEIEEKNKDILDSMKYALRIQQSFLPKDIWREI